MKVYLIEYIDPRLETLVTTKIEADDKTSARDKFFDDRADVLIVERITWIPDTKL